MENINETNLPLPFVKSFGLTSGAFVSGMVGLIFVGNCFNFFNFYSIDKPLMTRAPQRPSLESKSQVLELQIQSCGIWKESEWLKDTHALLPALHGKKGTRVEPCML